MPLHHFLRLRWEEGFSTLFDTPASSGKDLETYGARCIQDAQGDCAVFATSELKGLGVVVTQVAEIALPHAGRRGMFQHSISLTRASSSPVTSEDLLLSAFDRIYGPDDEGQRIEIITALYSVLSCMSYEESAAPARRLFVRTREVLAARKGRAAPCIALELIDELLDARPDLRERLSLSPQIVEQLGALPPRAEWAPLMEVEPTSEVVDLHQEPRQVTEAVVGSKGGAEDVEHPTDPTGAALRTMSTADVREVLTLGQHEVQSPRVREPSSRALRDEERSTLPAPQPSGRLQTFVRLGLPMMLVSLVGVVFGISRLDTPEERLPERVEGPHEHITPSDSPPIINPATPANANGPTPPPISCYVDVDQDGHAVNVAEPPNGTSCVSVDQMKGTVDCDDADGRIFPGANHVPGVDANCDGTIDLPLPVAVPKLELKVRKNNSAGTQVIVSISASPPDACTRVVVGHGGSSSGLRYGTPIGLRENKLDCFIYASVGAGTKGSSCSPETFSTSLIGSGSPLIVSAACCRATSSPGAPCEQISKVSKSITLEVN